jgi:hypothetical protein
MKTRRVHFLVQNWQEISKTLTNILDFLGGFVHSMAKKRMKTFLNSLKVDKNVVGEYTY